jgi:hypothetical protein
MWKNIAGKYSTYQCYYTSRFYSTGTNIIVPSLSQYSVVIDSSHPRVETHSDPLIAKAVIKCVHGFDQEVAWEAVWKDATVPPKDDTTVS